jgi:hypothetical protein
MWSMTTAVFKSPRNKRDDIGIGEYLRRTVLDRSREHRLHVEVFQLAQPDVVALLADDPWLHVYRVCRCPLVYGRSCLLVENDDAFAGWKEHFGYPSTPHVLARHLPAFGATEDAGSGHAEQSS